MSVKKLLRIDGYNNSPYSGNLGGSMISFALVSKPTPETRRQATPLYTCRDFINDTLRATVHKAGSSYQASLDFNKLRLLISKGYKDRKQRYALKEKLFSAKRLINLYEEIAEWGATSTISTVRVKGKGQNGKEKLRTAWLLTGPVQWLNYSQLTSMITLIFRVAANYGPIEFRDIVTAEEWFEDLLRKYGEDRQSGITHMDSDLSSYLPKSYKMFYMLMKYYNEIFTDSMKEAYPKEGNVHSSGGIYSLCSFNTGNSGLDTRMQETWKKYEKVRQERVRKNTDSKYEMEQGAPSL